MVAVGRIVVVNGQRGNAHYDPRKDNLFKARTWMLYSPRRDSSAYLQIWTKSGSCLCFV